MNIDDLIATADLTDAIEIAGDVYMRRHYVAGWRPGGPDIGWGVRVHEILRSDAGRDLHDHPWDFVSVLISGRYIELTPTGEQEYGPGSINRRKAEDLHRLVLPDGPVVTVFMTGPKRRKWGFDAPGGWLPYDEYPDLMRLREEP